jgi:hypothetical protein
MDQGRRLNRRRSCSRLCRGWTHSRMCRDMRGSGVIRVLVLLRIVVFPQRWETHMLTRHVEVPLARD